MLQKGEIESAETITYVGLAFYTVDVNVNHVLLLTASNISNHL